jgi:probable O-glycosylation ligase (exosortase A-associated)
MRDIIIVGIVLLAALVALRRPWIGVMLWTWLSIMNPHRYTYGFAYTAPLAALAAAVTLLGLLMTRDRSSPFKGPAVTAFVLFTIWMTLSWGFGLSPAADYPQWDKVMKINLMVFVALILLSSKKHVFALVWVAAGSLAILGAKGGVFTVLTGGSYRVWGPPGSFIQDNNEFALALVMTIPLLRFLQMQLVHGWGRRGMTVVMLLCAAAALGSHSRGALLAISAMTLMLWWRGKNKGAVGIVLVIAGVLLVSFMPDEWTNRMSTIDNYQEDRSALGRISAWWTAWNLAFHYPLGVGFNFVRPELFALYSPTPDYVHAAHSIYFLVLGNHGFVGLLLFLLIWFFTWSSAGWLRKNAAGDPQTQWAADLGGMAQVSLLGYAVGGAFLSLSYFDLPYYIMVMVVVARVWVKTKGWEREPVYTRGWRTIPGLATSTEPGDKVTPKKKLA